MKPYRRYRLHITCPARHTTYWDYKTKRAAIKNLLAMTDRTDWHATHVSVVTNPGTWQRVDGMQRLVGFESYVLQENK
jgi:hypothetical protein